jgi:hypothetical protein
MITVGGVVRAYPGEACSGDAFFVDSTPQRVVIALVDALGHGPVAAAAAKLAIDTIRAHVGQSPSSILEACHRSLLRGRGAAISIVALDQQGQGTFAGVGNVSARICPESSKMPLLPTAGVIGHQYRSLRETPFRLPLDSVGFLHSDGVSSRADPTVSPPGPLESTASNLITTWGRSTDDACVVLFAHHGNSRFRSG